VSASTVPETRFARAGSVDIAYQSFGSGDAALVWVPGWISHVEAMWDLPEFARFLERLASFSRVVTFDKRGTGMSDRIQNPPTLEERMDDVRAVMDAAELERAVLFGWTDAGAMLALFAGTYPDRVEALIVGEPTVKQAAEDDHPWGIRPEFLSATVEATAHEVWGSGSMLALIDPSAAQDAHLAAWWRRYERLSSTPNAVATMVGMVGSADVRPFLASVQAPTLVLHRREAQILMPGASQFFADQIAHAEYRELPGDALAPYLGDQDSVLTEVEEFVTGRRPSPQGDRYLATVVFTDIVDSTKHAERLGDAAWRDTLLSHYSMLEQQAARYGGRIVDTTGDGALAVFDGPTRAVSYARAAVELAHGLGQQIRAGVHTGEVVDRGSGDLAGMAVHIGARVSSAALADEVLVSSTVRDLTVGSDLTFTERGPHDLKGVPGPWVLYALVTAQHVPDLAT
jgi:class 3 adenylate cyclase